jgi:uncharacterized membrane protein YgcG
MDCTIDGVSSCMSLWVLMLCRCRAVYINVCAAAVKIYSGICVSCIALSDSQHLVVIASSTTLHQLTSILVSRCLLLLVLHCWSYFVLHRCVSYFHNIQSRYDQFGEAGLGSGFRGGGGGGAGGFEVDLGDIFESK